MFVIRKQRRVKQMDGINHAAAELGEMFRIGENLLGGRTPAQSFRIVQGKSSFGRSPAQFTAECLGIQTSGAKNGAQPPDFPQQFFQHFIPVGGIFGNELRQIEVNHLTQSE